jgi:exodeoxyribonuclease VII large subunit
MSPQVISVTEFVDIINETLGFAYPQVTVEGEVSSFNVNRGKFVFFDLKDENNTLGCFMMVHQLKLPLEDGMKVRVTGSPKVTKFSKFSLTVREYELAGEGELRRALELLRKKLEAEGLFDPARKRPVPTFPRRIGLVTSAASAAYADFIKILGARWGGVEVLVADVAVQGTKASEEIVGALEYFNHLADPADVLVLIRGGGSLEDLAAFSTEPVTRAVAASRTPIVVGVGHEVDTSLADYAADLRAATPTDAARLVAPDRREIMARVNHLSAQAESALAAAITARVTRTDRAVGQLEASLRRPREQLQTHTTTLWRGLDRLSSRQALITARTAALERLLRGLDPKAVLDRGYAIVRDDSGRLLRDPATTQPDQPVAIQLAKGPLSAKVTKS